MALLMTMVTEHNTTLVFVSHDMSLSSYFSRTAELSDINRALGGE
jgi:putative ABC transport system ATP-binding protein